MKLRIKGNTIRLRLLKSEVDRLASAGRITEQTVFGPGVLRYTLASSADAESMTATFHNNEILITIAADLAREWTTGDAVTLESDVDGLSILVEKDFACLDRPDDPDREDAFPNPHAACAPGE
jgi:hypothetical protein